MGRPRVIEHGLTQYNKGCRCDICLEAEATFRKTSRHRIDPVEMPVRGPGPNEVGVLAEISGLRMAELRPGIVQAALTMARVLDNRVAVAQHPQAANRLAELLETLHKGGDARVGRLASVKKIAGRAS